jgi:L-rhamnose mutarotase
MFPIALKVVLKEGQYNAYKKAHAELWPEIAASMTRNGISMSIHRDGNQLFVFATAPTKSAWLDSRDDSDLKRWNRFMTNYLQTNEQGDITFDELEQVFGFGSLLHVEAAVM